MAKFLHETWILLIANIRVSLRSVVWVVIGLFQPVCYLLLFAPLLDSLKRVPGFPAGGTYNVFTPGLLVMMAIFSTGFSGFSMLAWLRAGVVERLRVTPVSRLAILFSMVIRDVLTLLVQSTLLLVMALLLGLRPDWAGLLLLLPLIVLIGVAMASLSYGLALLLKDEGALASAVNFLAIPLLLLSGITLPLTLAPSIIQNIAKANPFAYAVDAARATVNGHLDDTSVLIAFIIFAVLTVLTLYWATGSVRKATA
ncbi:MAG: ABC transporter permease [Chloroflexia bacterium]